MVKDLITDTMKKNLIITFITTLLLCLISCGEVLEDVSFGVTPDSGNVYEAGKEVYFNFSGNPDYIVTGTVEQAWLREVSATELATSMRATYRLASRDGKKISKETLNSSQTRSGIPSSGAAEEIMISSLRDLVQPMARKIKAIVDGK